MLRDMKSRIVQDPGILCGKPVVRGTRISVELILRKLGQGVSETAILASYPHLTRADLRAAVRFAADFVADETSLIPAGR